MSAQVIDLELHPLAPVDRCLDAVSDALGAVPAGPLPAADPEVLEALVAQATACERAVAELRLRISRAAEQSRAGADSAATDTGARLARLTGSGAAVMRGGLWLARLLEQRYSTVQEAFAAGDLGEEHARVIVKAAEKIPAAVTDVERQEAVTALVEAAVQRRLDTRSLRRRARRMLERVNRSQADRHEAALLADEEERADMATWFFMGDNGDGTWTGKFVVPDLHASLLRTVLEHLSSPRRNGRSRAGVPITDPTIADRTTAWSGLGYGDRMGQAFLELCEHLPTDGLAQHGRVGATIAVHIDHQHLLDGLAGAHLDSGGDLSAGQARRLACNSGIMPVVYGGASVPLDAGRTARLHSKAQRIVLSGRFDTCAAEGCARPFAWCEIHHPHAWALGGRTDLTGIPLCGWHHRRAHDGVYDLRTLPTGEVRYRRRR